MYGAYIDTHTILVPAQAASVNSVQKYQNDGNPGILFTDGHVSDFKAGWIVPADFLGSLTVAGVFVPVASGNLYYQLSGGYGALAEATTAHTFDSTATTYASTIAVMNVATAVALSSAAVGDYVSWRFRRDASNAADTINESINFWGILVSYQRLR